MERKRLISTFKETPKVSPEKALVDIGPSPVAKLQEMFAQLVEQIGKDEARKRVDHLIKQQAKSFGATFVKPLLKEKGITQTEAAEKIQVSLSAFTKFVADMQGRYLPITKVSQLLDIIGLDEETRERELNRYQKEYNNRRKKNKQRKMLTKMLLENKKDLSHLSSEEIDTVFYDVLTALGYRNARKQLVKEKQDKTGLGPTLQEEFKKKGITNASIADTVGWSESKISRYFNSKNILSLTDVKALLDLLDLSPGTFQQYKDQAKKEYIERNRNAFLKRKNTLENKNDFGI